MGAVPPPSAMQFSLGAIDYAVLGVYFVFVIAIGWLLRRRVQSSQDFLTSHHSVPLWITSLAFIAANLGAQEVMGMAASGAKYGAMTFHFYWAGAIPAMIFVGVTRYRVPWDFLLCVLAGAALVALARRLAESRRTRLQGSEA